MPYQFRWKRVIDGKAYNTETATLIGTWESQYSAREEAIFKTRHGAYFLCCYDANIEEEWLDPLDLDDAQKWIEEHCEASVWELEFGEAPEAGDPEARITLRVPESLRKRIAVLAETQHQSLNAWILRCVERCAASSDQEGSK